MFMKHATKLIEHICFPRRTTWKHVRKILSV